MPAMEPPMEHDGSCRMLELFVIRTFEDFLNLTEVLSYAPVETTIATYTVNIVCFYLNYQPQELPFVWILFNPIRPIRGTSGSPLTNHQQPAVSLITYLLGNTSSWLSRFLSLSLPPSLYGMFPSMAQYVSLPFPPLALPLPWP